MWEWALGRSLILDVVGWAAIVSAESVEQLGAAADASIIPDQQRRRLPAFTRDVIRCTLPLLVQAPGRPVILGAAHGDMQSTVKLLTDLANREILSPALFALSVHNAAAGAMSLSLDAPGDQTALAGNAATLSASLVEAYSRLTSDEADGVVVCYAEAKLPPIYAEQDENAPGVFLALSLRLASDEPADEVAVGTGRAGAIDAARALTAGGRRLRFRIPSFEAVAA